MESSIIDIVNEQLAMKLTCISECYQLHSVLIELDNRKVVQMTTIQDYDLRDIFRIERRLLLLCGIYPNEGKINNFLYLTSSVYHVSFSFLITVPLIIYVTMNLENILSIAEVLLFLVTQTALLCKIFNMLKKKQQIIEIEGILSSPTFYGYPREKIAIVDGFVRPTKMFGVLYRLMCGGAALAYGIYPLTTGDEWALPLPGWYPTKIDTRLKHWLVFFFQWLSYSASAYINSTIDMLICMLFTVATSQIELLKDNLRKIRYDTEEAKSQFNENVVLHYEILRLLITIENTFSHGMLIQFFCSVVVICFTEFEMLLVSPTSMQFVSLVVYLNCMLLQVTMYCWFGHNIIASSDKINEAIYMSNWYESDSALKKSIIIFMERCKKPVVVRAGGMFPLSLITFTSIMRSSYSYFAVLRRLYGPE